MAPADNKFDHPFIDSLLKFSTQDPSEEQPILVNSKNIHEWLEEQAAESLRGQIHDKPRWSE